MKKILIPLILLLLILLGSIGFAEEPPARDLVASLAQLPGLADSTEKGAFVDLVKAMDEVYTGGKIEIGVYPFARSFKNVIEGKVDFHIPNMKNPIIPESKLPYRYVIEKMGTVSFVIYSNQTKIITRKNIDDAIAKGGKFPYIIEVGAGSEDDYPFPGIPSNVIDQSLLKVQQKRIDALLFAQEEVDRVLKQLKLKSIHREHYGDFDDGIIIPKSSRGDGLNEILSECLRKLKASGKLQEIYKRIHLPYKEWQPANMGW